MGISVAGYNAVTNTNNPLEAKIPRTDNVTDTAAAGLEDLSARGTHDVPVVDDIIRYTVATGFITVGV